MNLNKVFIIGRLTRNPEVKALPSGQSVTSFGMATDNYYTDKSGQKQQQTEFHNIVAFGRLADIAAQYLTKGSLALIEGRIKTRTWQDPNGVQKSRTEITAERLQLGPKPASASRDELPQTKEESHTEDIPVIEENDIDVKDIPF
ncbi:MAG: single-stranded DNA-binding protein [Candidatus Pacebacteria bacterium]|nr:single-stranded DNA-binding protein [Candidatus Paceibacterota bacterium]